MRHKDTMSDNGIRNLEELREEDGRAMPRGVTIAFVVLGGACIGFAALALGLAGAGIFAMMHYIVAQRTREIGIRMALGASRAAVVGMVLHEGLVLVAAGCGIGLAGSLLFSRFIHNLLFEVGPGDPATLSAVSLLLAGIALLACYIPARRATRVDPVIALRCD